MVVRLPLHLFTKGKRLSEVMYLPRDHPIVAQAGRVQVLLTVVASFCPG